MFELESAIEGWRREMAAGWVDVSEILDELESHMREDIAHHLQSGSTAEEAFAAAAERMGNVKKLKEEFTTADVLTGILNHQLDTKQTAPNMKKQIQTLVLTGWLLPTGLALLYMARWIREIVVPTLKGGNFDQLYDLHQVRYLDTTLVFTVVAFAWATVAVIQWARKHTNGSEPSTE